MAKKAESGKRKAEPRQIATDEGLPSCELCPAEPVAETKRPEIEASAIRCPACSSTERDRYSRTTAQAFPGTGPDGQAFTHVVRRWTRCAACGQARVERSLENRGEGRGTRDEG